MWLALFTVAKGAQFTTTPDVGKHSAHEKHWLLGAAAKPAQHSTAPTTWPQQLLQGSVSVRCLHPHQLGEAGSAIGVFDDGGIHHQQPR